MTFEENSQQKTDASHILKVVKPIAFKPEAIQSSALLKDRKEQPSAVIIDDHSATFALDASSVSAAPLEEASCVDFVRTTDAEDGERGVDRGTNFNGVRKLCPPVLEEDNGRKRHIIIDTLGLVLVVLVHAANVADVTHGSEAGCGRSFFQPIDGVLPVSGSKLLKRALTKSCSRVSTPARTRATQL